MSLAKQLWAAADAFRPVRTHQRYWAAAWWISRKWSPSNRYHTACGQNRKYMSERKKMHLTMEKEKSLEKREKLRCDMQPVLL